jgi:outer membrane lipoprotein SlyB
MKRWEWTSKILVIGSAAVLLGGCATPYGPYYSAQPTPPAVSVPAPAADESNILTVGPQDRFYVMHVQNQTSLGIRFPQSRRVLYEKGYDQVKRQREADFSLDISVITEARDNPEVRGTQALGGAILGAATGALLGAAAGAPVTGTIAGAAGGGFLGLAAPADTPMVRVDVRTQSFRDGGTSAKSVVIDMAHVPPYDAPRIIDDQVSAILGALPAR